MMISAQDHLQTISVAYGARYGLHRRQPIAFACNSSSGKASAVRTRPVTAKATVCPGRHAAVRDGRIDNVASQKDEVARRLIAHPPRCHISGRPAFRKPSAKWSRTDASRSGWEPSQWPIVK